MAPRGKNGSGLNTSSFTAPQTALPEGSGAIQGIGQKFASNPVTDAGSLTIPAFTTGSCSDFHSPLSLPYDSSSGNDPFAPGHPMPDSDPGMDQVIKGFVAQHSQQ